MLERTPNPAEESGEIIMINVFLCVSVGGEVCVYKVCVRVCIELVCSFPEIKCL